MHKLEKRCELGERWEKRTPGRGDGEQEVLQLERAGRSSPARGWRPGLTFEGIPNSPWGSHSSRGQTPWEAPGALTEMPEVTEGSSQCARPRRLVLATWSAVLRRIRKLDLGSEAERHDR